ncbi:MAG TPA: tyrosine-type recombinase/integrase [Pirellulaceae bacterium]|nr:tyrosine-type recombinase/integrase [Pirellulaceae bacterium]
MTHSKRRQVSSKPDKSDKWRKHWGLAPDFPLFPLPAEVKRGKPDNRRWAKKVCGRLEYFGKVDGDPRGVAALVEWLRVKDHLLARQARPPKDDQRLTLRELCNKFLASKRTDVDLGKLSPRTFVQYNGTTDALIEQFGRDKAVADLGPEDFERLYVTLAKRHGVTTLGREVTMVRSVFKYGLESDLLDRAVKYGPRFKPPSKADKRKHKARQKQADGARLFTAAEIHRMIDAARPQLRAMIYLGINAGLGNTDCATMPESALDLKAGWLDFPRPKTGVGRRVPLWQETVKAIEAVLAAKGDRIKPRDADDANLVFLTRLGQPWVRFAMAESKDDDGKVSVSGSAIDSVATETLKLLRTLGMKRKGLSFYTLRHTFATIAGGTADQVAVDAVMGHVDSSMAAEYREHIDDSRLVAVVNHVRKWLFVMSAKRGGKVLRGE